MKKEGNIWSGSDVLKSKELSLSELIEYFRSLSIIEKDIWN
jgi:hypothetical protein